MPYQVRANAKAALVAIQEVIEERKSVVPVMISVTITDRSGRTLSGQTLDAFYASIRHARQPARSIQHSRPTNRPERQSFQQPPGQENGPDPEKPAFPIERDQRAEAGRGRIGSEAHINRERSEPRIRERAQRTFQHVL